MACPLLGMGGHNNNEITSKTLQAGVVVYSS